MPSRSPCRRTIDVSTPNDSKRRDARVADVVRRNRRDEARVDAELRERRRDVRLGAAERRLEHRRLKQPLEARRLEPQHHFAERDDARHTITAGVLDRAPTSDARRDSSRMRSNCFAAIQSGGAIHEPPQATTRLNAR